MIRFTSTSFLLPSIHSWNSIKSNHDIFFEEYGNWHSALFQNLQDTMVWVIFLQDLFNDDLDGDGVDRKIDGIFFPVIKRLEETKEPLVIAWSGFRGLNFIQNAKQSGQWKQIRNRFQDSLYRLSELHKMLFIINLDDHFAFEGYNNAISLRNYYASRCWISTNGIKIVADAVEAIIARIHNPARKILVLDCDNTLWGGVVGEVGVSGILLGTDGMGKAFEDFQKKVINLSRNGLLLAISSKNNEQEVWDVFDQHQSMIIKRSDVVSSKINWLDKSENLKMLSVELDIALDSFVFWDDNPIEREKMKLLLPEVLTVEAPNEVYKWPQLVESLDCFTKFITTEEDLKKNDQYHLRAAFVSEKIANSDINGFLKSISMKPSMQLINEDSLLRAEQLCMKTNQFNLRTIRHSRSDIEEFIASDSASIVSLTDIYGDHGNIAIVLTERISDEVAFLDTFLMSCRVMGRFVESWIIDNVRSKLVEKGYKYLLAEFIPSGRNKVSESFLGDNNFHLCDKTSKLVQIYKSKKDRAAEGAFYFIETKTTQIPNLDIFTN